MARGQRFRELAWPVVSFVGGTAAVPLIVLGALIGVTHGTAKAIWIGIAALLALVQVTGQWWGRRKRQERERREKQSKADKQADRAEVLVRTHLERNIALGNLFTPLVRLIAEAHEERDPGKVDTLEGSTMRAVVAAAAAGIGPDNSRACFFRLQPATGDAQTELVLVHSSGRADTPHTRFVAGTTVGDEALRMIENDDYLFCPDTDAEPPVGWEEHPHEYRTFLSVPVRGMKALHGMLTLDAPEPGQLEVERDKPVLVALAEILAASQASAPFISTTEAPTTSSSTGGSDTTNVQSEGHR